MVSTSLLVTVVPLLAAFAVFFAKGRIVTATLVTVSVIHFGLSFTAISGICGSDFYFHGQLWLGLDALGKIFLGVTSLVFLLVSVHLCFYLPAIEKNNLLCGEKIQFMSTNVLVACLLGFLSAMTLVVCARNFGLLWVAVEATTLMSAPLICYRHSAASLEAMWKYLLICSVGIGLALFGTMLMAVSARETAGGELGFAQLLENSNNLHPMWFKAAFIFVLAGYGTKIGLAPFHSWLPDAYSESPGFVSALLSGALVNCSMVALMRFVQITPDALKPFSQNLMIFFGVFSLLVAALFIIRQGDYKRLLGYSSIENMGLAVLLLGLNLFDVSVVHLIGHSLLKLALFLVAGNILLAYGSRAVGAISGMFGGLPKNALLWIIGFLLICGTPPSPLFVTEILLLRGCGIWLALVVSVLLAAVFCGMSLACLKMCTGKETQVRASAISGKLWIVPALTIVAALVFGIFLTFKLAEIF